MPSLLRKIEATTFRAHFSTRNLLGRAETLCRHSIDCCIVSGCLSFMVPIATGKYLDRPKRIPNVAQTTGTAEVFDPRSDISGPTVRRASACQNLHE